MPPRNGIIGELEKAGLSLNKPHSAVNKQGLFIAKDQAPQIVAEELIPVTKEAEVIAPVSEEAVSEVPSEVPSEEQQDEVTPVESTENLKIDEKRPTFKRKKS